VLEDFHRYQPYIISPDAHTHEPDPTSRTPYLPICPACGKTMRLAQAKPHPHFVNLDECVFRCACGEQGEYVMMRPE
jgi:hypothetical protein